ncbi:hypothetical protein EOB59_29990 [Mesorhizobium sp. M7A.F.Ca.MR.176.00.0.0]|uniref:hypothetical protein n=1 Tax=Mesorhizobium sp. M7A.F.Ca.MR.176.00.0.0 TaxID=2496776 RepID=UPI000FD4CC79|nr:hypothetical protein [Mesorhizobium sp. M7A.F.Ca.MR.176.00.0.0]RUU86115.1 hypothetical protein EOB59_29990 [Mesorhizobium sp. M7A.F.Ca.MR.176.00.0.0]
MAGKRAPGGGRKPSGEFAGKSAAFSTRITPELRSALDAESESSGKSISQIVERRLRESYDEPKRMQRILGADHVRALAYLVAHLAMEVERQTRLEWHQDRFTFNAIVSAMHTAMSLYQADKGPEAVPVAIEEHIKDVAERLQKPKLLEMLEYMRNSEEFGISVGQRLADVPNVPPPLGDSFEYLDEMYLGPFLRNALQKDKGPNGVWLRPKEPGSREFKYTPPTVHPIKPKKDGK